MPSLVARKKTKESESGSPRVTYEVRALYLPFFLAADQALLTHLDQRLREKFKGERIFEGDHSIENQMSAWVIEAILEKRPILGLREVLEAIAAMTPEQRLPPTEIPNLEPEPPPEKKPPSLEVVSLDETLTVSDESVRLSPTFGESQEEEA